DSVNRLVGLDEKVGSTDILQWMRETFHLARSHAYPGIDGKPIKSGDDLGEAYFLRSEPVVTRQLATAGVRLAYLINQLAEGKLDTNIFIQ
ncbi:MAG TPA: S1/P1 nuclease, partial [Pseudomonadales bacterium]|nr:S1/P1 nuclease [Pseudomonadales bacterium]